MTGTSPAFFPDMRLLKELALSVVDYGTRILAVITLDSVNKLLATVIAALTIYHLVIKIRNEKKPSNGLIGHD